MPLLHTSSYPLERSKYVIVYQSDSEEELEMRKDPNYSDLSEPK
jgi:hypothetical protein